MAAELLVERRGEIAVLTLSHPEKANALTPALLESLARALPALHGEGARAAVLTGAGTTFSGGFDMTAMPESPDAEWMRGHGVISASLRVVAEGPLPVVAALPGPAVGAGCELALSCDLRVGHAGARLQMPPVRIGLVYTPEGVARLIALCGAGRAREMLLTALPVEAADAHAWGLLNRLVPAGEVLDTALELARRLAAQPRQALQGTRVLIERLVAEGLELSARTAEEILALRQAAWVGEDARAARRAFVERKGGRR